jgi:hypothetical protein
MIAPPISPSRSLTQILLGNRVQQAVYVAAKLGIADQVKDGPKTADDLARAIGVHPGALYRLLRVLASYEIFAEDEDHRFGLTPIASLLQTGTRESKRAFALWSGGLSYELFGALEYTIRTGKPAFDHRYGMEFFEYLAQNPEVGTLFDEFMSRQTAPVGPVVAACDFSGADVVVDVGGGRGELLAAVIAAHPPLRGVLVDRAPVIAGASRVFAAAGVADRCRIVSGDIFEAVPRGDVYLLKNIVHGLEDADASRVLTNCRAAMNRGGKLLLVEFVIAPGNDPSPGKLMDLLMLVGTRGGRERTEPEFRGLFASAGLCLSTITQTKYAYSLIEAVAT